MAEKKAEVVKRSAFLLFLDTTPREEKETYGLVGDGVTDLTVSYNPQTSTNQYIHEDTANTDLTGYQPNAPVTSHAMKGDPVFEYINEMRKRLPIGSDANSTIVTIDVFDENPDDTYPATRQPVSIQIDSYGGPASDPLSIGYTINWRGSGESGTFNRDTKTFTPGGASAVSLDKEE